jgi:hypothetical protein
VRPPPQGFWLLARLGSHGGSLWEEKDEEEIIKVLRGKIRERGMNTVLDFSKY